MNGLFLKLVLERVLALNWPLCRLSLAEHRHLTSHFSAIQIVSFVSRSEPAVLAPASEIHSTRCGFSTANSHAEMSQASCKHRLESIFPEH